jgi:hypothetical protein
MDISSQFEPTLEQINTLSRSLSDEIIKNAGVANHRIQRWLFKIALYPPTRKFARIAIRFDHMVRYGDFQQAARDLLDRFVDWIDVKGLEQVPQSGPLLIASNHPGTYDGLSIISSLPRDDLKVVIAGIPFTQELKAAGKHFIYSPPPDQTHGRMHTLRSSVRHLEAGGSLLLFPTGRVDPDPALVPGAEQALDNWSRSLEILFRKVPDTQVMLAMVSGVITPSSIKHPLTKILRNIENYKTAQFVQITGQLFSPDRNRPVPQISFGSPFLAGQLMEGLSGGKSNFDAMESLTILQALIERARERFFEHLEEFGLAPTDSWNQLATQ